MKALAIIVEGLGTSLVGAYGSAMATTPAIDRLAAQSLVLDQCFIDTFELRSQQRSLWTATHAQTHCSAPWSLWQYLRERGVSGRLITDCQMTADAASQWGCPQVTLVKVPSADLPAESVEECRLAHVFAAAMDEIAMPETTGLVWVHARGLKHAWDAPLDLRQAMTDPEDPTPPAEVCVPALAVDEQTDPDEVVGWGQVAAAQVVVLDEAIDALLQALHAREDHAEWTILLSSTGGTPLGEHGYVGQARQAAYSEEMAVPAMIRPSDRLAVGIRRAELCQLADLPVTLLAAAGVDCRELSALWGRNLLDVGPPLRSTQWSPEHTVAWLEHQGSTWIRTPAWSWLQNAAGESQLFVKPDDRWEVSDIANRQVDVVNIFSGLASQIREITQRGARGELPKLDDQLTDLVR